MSPRARLLALAATALGVWLLRGQLVTSEAALDLIPARRATATTTTATTVPARAELAVAAVAAARMQPGLALRESLSDSAADPFAKPRVVVKPPPPPVVVFGPPLPPPPPPPPPPPRVPYRFVGLLSERGKPSSVYLALGETFIEARPGDVLEGGFQLKSIAAKELTFLHQQSNLTVRLAVDGEPL